MNPTLRNKYLDGTIEVARQYRCDLFQIKYDGHWCQCVSSAGHQQYFSDTNRCYHATHCPEIPDGIFIGEFMRGTQWSKHPSREGHFYIFDIWELAGKPLVSEPYRKRYAILKSIIDSLSEGYHWHRVANYPLAARDSIWKALVVEQNYEGLVYRWSDSLNDYPIVREKATFTLDGTVIGFIEGEGKHSGRLGVLEVSLPSGILVSVGNGFSDTERESIWRDQPKYLGLTCEFTANKIFDSGNVRHARFLRWRDDK